MTIRIFILIHLIDDHGKRVSVHPSAADCYDRLCDYYHMVPDRGGVNIHNIDRALIENGVASAMHEHDDGYEIYEQTIDTNKFGS